MSAANSHNVPPPAIPLRTWKIAAVIGIGSFMVMLDTTVANLALESIRVEFDSRLATVQWTITAYLIALAMSLPLSGWLCSRFGYGRVWRAALLLFIASSALCAAANDPLSLTAARLLKGLAGGLLVPSGQAIVGYTAHPRQLGRVVGSMGFAVALGPALGPAVGGAVLEVASWRWLFGFNVPVGLLALFFARGLIEAGEQSGQRPLDLRGLLLLSSGLPLLLFGAAESGAEGLSALSAGAMGLGLLLVLGFVISSTAAATRVAEPILELRLFRNKIFRTAVLTAGLTGANMYGGLLLIPLYLQLLLDASTSSTGFILLILGLGTAVALPLAGQLTDRLGAGSISRMGAVLVLLSTLPFLLPLQYSWLLLAALMIMRGFGLAWAQMPAMTAAYASVQASQMGDAAALINIAQRLGGAMGAVSIVTVLNDAPSDAVTSYIAAFTLLCLLSLFTVLSASLLRHRQGQARAQAANC